jgi:DNA-binding CsgD family transcriptional regulator
MATDRTRCRGRELILKLVDGGLDAETLRLELIEALRAAIGFDTWGWPLADPAALLATTGIADTAIWPVVSRIVDYEERAEDLNKDRDLAGGAGPVATLDAATGGDLARSSRWRDILGPYGLGDELRAACVDRYGCWGHLRLYRDSAGAPFDPDDVELLRGVIAAVASALRHQAARPSEPTTVERLEPGIVILDHQLTARSWTSGAGSWFDAFAGPQPPKGANARCAVYSVAARCLAANSSDDHTFRSRLRLDDGRWVVADAARLHGSEGGVVVSVHQAPTTDIIDVLVRAHGLTPRERELVALVVEGLDTRDLARRLYISPNTVQQHLKSVFDKIGVRSRRQLATGIFGSRPPSAQS